mmetsp:Transcript_21711/g.34000  ORF Transcript_21711/g.34000 Transcript_21711/m.34000 type:complete len:100 (+) Transcript_21711:270-569(+)
MVAQRFFLAGYLCGREWHSIIQQPEVVVQWIRAWHLPVPWLLASNSWNAMDICDQSCIFVVPEREVRTYFDHAISQKTDFTSDLGVRGTSTSWNYIVVL